MLAIWVIFLQIQQHSSRPKVSCSYNPYAVFQTVDGSLGETQQPDQSYTTGESQGGEETTEEFVATEQVPTTGTKNRQETTEEFATTGQRPTTIGTQSIVEVEAVYPTEEEIAPTIVKEPNLGSKPEEKTGDTTTEPQEVGTEGSDAAIQPEKPESDFDDSIIEGEDYEPQTQNELEQTEISDTGEDFETESTGNYCKVLNITHSEILRMALK